MTKILLQDGATQRYVAAGGCWSETPDAGLVFSDLGQARDYARSHGLAALRIVGLSGGTCRGAAVTGAQTCDLADASR